MTRIKFLLKSLIFSCLFFVFAAVFARAAEGAPRFFFDPSPASLTTNVSTQIKLQIDAESNAVGAADATINFPNADVTVTVENGGFFTDFYVAPSSNKIEIHGYFSAQFQTKTGLGTFAILNVTGNKGSGDGTISFSCDGSGNDTEILNANGNNILSCSSLSSLTLNYVSASSGTSTNGPTNACGGTCGSNYNCNSGLYCYTGYCRNPDCANSVNCSCPPPSPSPTAKPKQKTIARATPEVVVLAPTTPYPTAAPATSPSATPIPENQSKSSLMPLAVWVGLGLIAVIVIIITVNALKKKNPPQINPPTTDTYHVEPPMPPGNPPSQNLPPTGF